MERGKYLALRLAWSFSADRPARSGLIDWDFGGDADRPVILFGHSAEEGEISSIVQYAPYSLSNYYTTLLTLQ